MGLPSVAGDIGIGTSCRGVVHKVCALLHYIMYIPLEAVDGYMLFSLLLAEKRREHVKGYIMVLIGTYPPSQEHRYIYIM